LSKNIIRIFFLTLGAVFAVLLLFVGIVGYFITGPAPIDEWGTNWVEPTNEAADSLDENIETLKQEIEDAAIGENLTLVITEEEATSKLDRLARDGNLSVEIQHPQIYFGDGMVRAFAKVDMGIDVQVAIQAKIGVVEDGKPDITIESLNLGKIPIPKTLINNVMPALERELEERWADLSVTLREITLEDGVMTVTLVKE